jgi:hypothetical protein
MVTKGSSNLIAIWKMIENPAKIYHFLSEENKPLDLGVCQSII